MNPNDAQKYNDAVYAEQSVLGALLIDNDALDRVPDLRPGHFHDTDHRLIYTEIRRQVSAGKGCDVITLVDALHDKLEDCPAYLNQLAQAAPSAVSIARHARIVIDHATRRSLVSVAREIIDAAQGVEPVDSLADRFVSRIEALAQKNVRQEPQRMGDMMGAYVDLVQSRMDGTIKPISTGYANLDRRLDGGLERGTLTIVAGRPGTGKTAMGLGIARNVAEWGTALFLSMEMPAAQVNDRNISALGKVPLSWLKKPTDDQAMWAGMTAAFHRSQELSLYIDDETSLNMLAIRAKSRNVKRLQGLDLVVVDQLSFITGGDPKKESWEQIGEYTRGLMALAKEMDVAVVLLCQLNRKLEDRQNKRPQMSDLALSGSIEQDAATILLLYRDELYNPDSPDKDICEVIVAKQRQGEPGRVALTYVGSQTRFEDLTHDWKPADERGQPHPCRGFE